MIHYTPPATIYLLPEESEGSEKMIPVLKCIWISSITISSVALIYSLIGSTANFKRSPNTDWGYYLFFFGIPVAIFILISILCIIFQWFPRSVNTQKLLVAIAMLIALITIITPTQMKIQKEGWLTERVSTIGITSTTEDGIYEYYLEIINPSQRNSGARLFLYETISGEEFRIPLYMSSDKITIRLARSSNEENVWATLIPSSSTPSIYILSTTMWLNDNIEVFEINVTERSSKKLID